jgi:hypothetical protein
MFDAPQPDDAPSRRPAPVHKSRHWPWAVGGALIGGVAMLMVGLGASRVDVDPQIERLVRLATHSTAQEPMTAPPSASVGPVPSGADPAAPRAEPEPSPGGAAPIEARSVETGQAIATGSSTIAPVQAATTPPAAAREEAPPPRKAQPARSTPVAEADPASACAPRSNFSLYLCMKTQCERTAWYAHPQCVQLRREDER